MPYLRADQADIRVTVDNVPYGDSWRTASGGNLKANSSKVRPGGMGRQVAVGGPAERDNVTVGIEMSDIVAGWHATLESKIGNGRVKVAYQFLGPDRTPVGPTHTIKGTLDEANLPDNDSDDGDVGDYELVVLCDELAA
jgi:hypothetical protein